MEELIPALVQLLQSNPYFSVITAVVTIASTIATVTPKPKEGTVLSKAYTLLNLVALNIFYAKNK